MIKSFEKLSIIFFFEGFFSFSQPNITHYNTDNSGLSFNTVRCIVIQNNIKWFGTDNGLCSFDGQNWQSFTTENSPLLDDDIRSLKVENDSILWIGTIQGGLYKKTNNTWINYNESNSGLHDNLVRGIEIDSLGVIWLATSEGVSNFDGQNWQLWSIANSSLLTNNITSIKTGFLNEKYVGTINGGLLYFDALDNLTIHSIVESGLPDNSSLAIDIDSTGQPWFATPAAGLVTDLGNGGPWQRWNVSNSPIPTNGLTSIAINPEDGRIFIGTQLSGIVIKKEDVWFNYNTNNTNLPEDYITCIVHENQFVKWAGTFNSGVVRIEEPNAHLFDYEIQSLKLYPTVIENNDELNLSELVNGSITILNNSGQIVQEQIVQETSEIRLNVPTSGFYYVKLITNLKIYIFKIIVK